MPFVIIPICYIEVDASEDEESDVVRLQKKGKGDPHVYHADVTINTNAICSYVGEDETNHTMVTMVDGTTFECTIDREAFGILIVGAEAIVSLSDIKEN
jgi:hypothetical protein